ncbi:glycosyltransferase family 4 protein [Methanosarcina barkeri]|uniref:Glycosyl transferase GT4 family n=1 Tax=Methanosarcina barkeri CM1 TaxID=796385 RepID=A0A0G3CGH7_METBA|nr:glycosyltransferase family 4 protein [Methanosarcina barkeri]AKJ39840.1 glycosyl transferase GT4 family [Methanosarcina barkeri CM1]
MKKPYHIGVITGKWEKNNKSISTTSKKLLKILKEISDQLYVVSANHDVNYSDENVHFKKINVKDVRKPFIIAIYYFLLYQVNVSIYMIKLIFSKKIDVFIFCFGADLFIFPILIAKLFCKKIVIRTDARSSVLLRHSNQPKYKIFLFSFIEFINYSLANRILPEAEYMIKYYNLERYINKIVVGPLYIEDIFTKTNNFDTRDYDVGYIGRFSKEKGILELSKALCILKEDIEINALFVGDGDLKYEMIQMFDSYNIKVNFVNWIKKEEVPLYLNNVKLFVLPSFKEGMPNVLMESMACGTPVLATEVGGIPDLVKDKFTGFILYNNTPQCIAKGIKKSLEFTCLNEMSDYIYSHVKNLYSYQNIVNIYINIFKTL